MSSSRSLDSYFVFVARFDDWRKDEIAFQRGNSRDQAERRLRSSWYSNDQNGVHVDSLGAFPDFFTVTPKLNYDFKQTPALPDTLIDHVGRANLEQIVRVAADGDKGWDSLPSQNAVLAVDDTSNPKDSVFGGDHAWNDPSRTYLTDKIIQFQSRVRRLVKADYVDYERLEDRNLPSALHEDDRPVAELLEKITSLRTRCPSGDILFFGVILTPEGIPRTTNIMWGESRSNREDPYPRPENNPEFDLVIPVVPEDSKRDVQHRVLNTLGRWRLWTELPAFSHEWRVVETGDEITEYDVYLVFSHSPENAVQRAKCKLGVPSRNTDSDTDLFVHRGTFEEVTADVSIDDFQDSEISVGSESSAKDFPPMHEQLLHAAFSTQ